MAFFRNITLIKLNSTLYFLCIAKALISSIANPTFRKATFSLLSDFYCTQMLIRVQIFFILVPLSKNWWLKL